MCIALYAEHFGAYKLEVSWDSNTGFYNGSGTIVAEIVLHAKVTFPRNLVKSCSLKHLVGAS